MAKKNSFHLTIKTIPALPNRFFFAAYYLVNELMLQESMAILPLPIIIGFMLLLVIEAFPIELG